MIVWGTGGWPSGAGGIFDPASNTWTGATSVTGAPNVRSLYTAVWTGSRMIVWGGLEFVSNAHVSSTGGAYSPSTDTWTATQTDGAPEPRWFHTAVSTGSKMIVWGGGDAGLSTFFNTGGVYDPVTDTWTATTTSGAPAPRAEPVAVWTGSKMIVWGGADDAGECNTGGIYDPDTDTWTATTTVGAPRPRNEATVVWTGSRMIVWGGVYRDGSNFVVLDTGGVYDPVADQWTATTPTGAPSPRAYHTAIWTGSGMVVWGGQYYTGSGWSAGLNTGGMYADPTLLPSPTDFHTLDPCRVADTRNPAGLSGGPALGANTTRTFPVAGICGVPSTAIAVAINVTVVNATDLGNLRVYPAGGGTPGASTINFTVNKVRANNAVIPLGTGGEIGVRCDMPAGSTGQTDFLFDVTGYFE